MSRQGRSPAHQNTLIKQMTSSLKKTYEPFKDFLRGEPKAKPYSCEHCNEVMTKTGRLPARTDQYSWTHWIGWTVGENGVQKVHSLSMASDHGQCCVACFKAFQQWAKEMDNEAEAKAEAEAEAKAKGGA